MALPIRTVERLFDRLTTTYGTEFTNVWKGLNMNAVKTTWAHELSFYADRLKDIAWALENLPDRAPNLIQFKNLCRQAPSIEQKQLPPPEINCERMKAELEKLTDIHIKAADKDKKEWARRLVQRAANGERITSINLRFAKMALKEQM
jgi:hypothetical protein